MLSNYCIEKLIGLQGVKVQKVLETESYMFYIIGL